MKPKQRRKIAIIGGGPSGLFLYKSLIEIPASNFTIDIFETKKLLGAGMPYSGEGANDEHITNVSSNEIPKLVTSVVEWLETLPAATLQTHNLGPGNFNEFKVIPRLLFGEYLSAQFELLLKQGEEAGIETLVHSESTITDVIDCSTRGKVTIEVNGIHKVEYDHAILCMGHSWPKTHEGVVPGYFDSPYPPHKLRGITGHEVAIRGSSLTAIDAIRTLSRQNGSFRRDGAGSLSYLINEGGDGFKIVMHSREGLLPGIRFHLDDPMLSKDSLLSPEEIANHRQENGGFVSLDFIFEHDFKHSLRTKDPSFYQRIKEMALEEFVNTMMDMREQVDPFSLFKREYKEANASIRHREPIHWKEMLAVLSFAVNYPAKHMSAEDMLRIQNVLMPLISIVIAFVPQRSCEEMIALHDAGRLDLISVGDDNELVIDKNAGILFRYTNEENISQEKKYSTFIDCIGQKHLSIDSFPFKSLVRNGSVSDAMIKFRSPERAMKLRSEGNHEIKAGTNNDFYLKVPGIAINDSFRIIDVDGIANPRIHVMAVSYIGGFNPDYSGLDFCQDASKKIVADIVLAEGVTNSQTAPRLKT